MHKAHVCARGYRANVALELFVQPEEVQLGQAAEPAAEPLPRAGHGHVIAAGRHDRRKEKLAGVKAQARGESGSSGCGWDPHAWSAKPTLYTAMAVASRPATSSQLIAMAAAVLVRVVSP